MSKKNDGKILTDHKKVGKKLLPPLMHQMSGITPSHYDRDTLPELVWLALIESMHGLRVTASIAGEIGAFVKESKSNCRFITLTEMKDVTEPEWNALGLHLSNKGLLDFLSGAIHDLVFLYPECPLKNLMTQIPEKLEDDNFLAHLETLVADLTYKRGRRAVLMQANALYLLGSQGKLFIKEGLSLGNFEALKDYPDTEESKKVGASICASSSMVVMLPENKESILWRWPEYFWGRNLELVPIVFKAEECSINE
jgi:hypothetical protein